VVQRLQGASYQDVSTFIPGHGSSVEPHDYAYLDESAQPGHTYNYRLKEIDLDGSITYSNPVSVTLGLVALNYRLNQNYPNPFNPQTTLAYDLAQAGKVTLAIYDPAGRLVRELVSGNQEAGSHTVVWNAIGLPSGIYLCRLQAGGQIFNRSLTLVK
jgi:hypothetical protein